MPTPSGPRCAILSRMRSTISGLELAPPGLNAPTMPHMVLLPRRRPADDPPAPASPHPVQLPPQVVDDRVADDDLVRPPGFLLSQQSIAPVHFRLQVLGDLRLRLRLPLVLLAPGKPSIELRRLEAGRLEIFEVGQRRVGA